MIKDILFRVFALSCLFVTLVVLLTLLAGTVYIAWPRLSLAFFLSVYSRYPAHAGIATSLAATAWLMLLSILIAVPIGTAAGIYMEEYLRKGRWSALLEANMINLAGIPAVIYGILGLELVTQVFHSQFSLATGAFIISLMILPSIIVGTREAIREVPASLKSAAMVLGASRWQIIERICLPLAFPALLRGVMKAVARVAGTTAPLLIMGGPVYVPFGPSSLGDPFTALPVQIYGWIIRPGANFAPNAAAGILVLLGITVSFNLMAMRSKNRIS